MYLNSTHFPSWSAFSWILISFIYITTRTAYLFLPRSSKHHIAYGFCLFAFLKCNLTILSTFSKILSCFLFISGIQFSHLVFVFKVLYNIALVYFSSFISPTLLWSYRTLFLALFLDSWLLILTFNLHLTYYNHNLPSPIQYSQFLFFLPTTCHLPTYQ